MWYEYKLPFASRAKFIFSKIWNCSAHVSGVIVPAHSILVAGFHVCGCVFEEQIAVRGAGVDAPHRLSDRCLKEGKNCRSATYDSKQQTCYMCPIISRSDPSQYVEQPDHEYIENLCLKSKYQSET